MTAFVARIRRQLSDARPAKHAGLILLALAAFTVVGTSAWAYWTTIGHGTASATTGTLNPPTSVTASNTAGSSTVTVSWTASTGTTVPQGYYVTRIKSDTTTAFACGSSLTTFATSPCTDSAVPDGTFHYTVTAVYHSWSATSTSSGDVTVTSSIATTTAVTSSSNPSVVGQSVLYTATVTPNSGSATPTGTVTFKDGAATITCVGGNQTLNGSGVATCPFTYTSVGTPSITAEYAGAGSFIASTSTAFTQTVNPASQTITFTSTAPGAATVGGSTYTVTATASSGLPVVLSVDGASTGCTLSGSTSGSTVSFTAVGTCKIDANQTGNANYLAAPQVQQSFTVGQGAQAITFTSIAPTSATVGGSTYTVTATGGASGNAVTFAIDASATSICSITGSTVSFTAVGTCLIDANQAGNTNYLAAPQKQQSFAVGMGAQTITFTSTAPSAFVGGSYTVAASATSGLPVTFTSATTLVCTVSTSTVTFIAAGTCTINADQAGNANYNAAPQVHQTFTVSTPGTTLSITSFVNDVGNSVTASGTAAYGTAGDSANVTVVFCLANTFPCSSANTQLTKTVTINPTNGAWTAQTGNVNKLKLWVQATQTRVAGNLLSNISGPVTG